MSTLVEHRFSFLIQNWRRMNCVLCLIFLMLISFKFVGCAIIPLPSTKAFEEKPFLGEEISSIEVGITTKTEVEYLFGAPDATRRKSTIYIYAEPHIYGYCCFGIGPAGTMKRLEKHHLLIVQFDKNGVVKDVDHIVGNKSCTQNGICVADTGLRSKEYWSSYPKPEDISIQQMLVLYSDRSTEQNTKNFIAPHGKSVIFVYYKKLYFPAIIQKVSVNLDGIELGDFGQKGFFCWIVDPGYHSIRITPLWPERESRWWHSASINIECKEGQIYFVEQTWKSKQYFPIQDFHVRLNTLSNPIKGREEILKRKMVLDNLSQTD